MTVRRGGMLRTIGQRMMSFARMYIQRYFAPSVALPPALPTPRLAPNDSPDIEDGVWRQNTDAVPDYSGYGAPYGDDLYFGATEQSLPTEMSPSAPSMPPIPSPRASVSPPHPPSVQRAPISRPAAAPYPPQISANAYQADLDAMRRERMKILEQRFHAEIQRREAEAAARGETIPQGSLFSEEAIARRKAEREAKLNPQKKSVVRPQAGNASEAGEGVIQTRRRRGSVVDVTPPRTNLPFDEAEAEAFLETHPTPPMVENAITPAVPPMIQREPAPTGESSVAQSFDLSFDEPPPDDWSPDDDEPPTNPPGNPPGGMPPSSPPGNLPIQTSPAPPRAPASSPPVQRHSEETPYSPPIDSAPEAPSIPLALEDRPRAVSAPPSPPVVQRRSEETPYSAPEAPSIPPALEDRPRAVSAPPSPPVVQRQADYTPPYTPLVQPHADGTLPDSPPIQRRVDFTPPSASPYASKQQPSSAPPIQHFSAPPPSPSDSSSTPVDTATESPTHPQHEMDLFEALLSSGALKPPTISNPQDNVVRRRRAPVPNPLDVQRAAAKHVQPFVPAGSPPQERLPIIEEFDARFSPHAREIPPPSTPPPVQRQPQRATQASPPQPASARTIETLKDSNRDQPAPNVPVQQAAPPAKTMIQREDIPTRPLTNDDHAQGGVDVDELAHDVFRRLKHRLRVDRERRDRK